MKNISHVKQIRKMIAPSVWADGAFCLLCCSVALLTIGEPLLLSKLLNCVTNQQIPRCGVLPGAVILLFLFRIGLDYVKSCWQLQYRNQCIHTLSSHMFQHILSAKLDCLEAVTPSYLVSRMTDELMNIDGVLDFTMIDNLISLVICSVIFVLMLIHSWGIALITLAMILVDGVIAFRLPLTKIYKEYNETQAELKSETVNTLQGVIPIKMGGCYKKEEDAFGRGMGALLRVMFRKHRMTRLQRMSGSVCRQFGYLLLIVVCAFLIGYQKLDLGQFTLLLCLYNLLWSHIVTVENMVPLYRYGKVTCERIGELLEMETEELGGETEAGSLRPHPQEGKADCVELSDVDFCYHADRQILNKVSLTAREGEITAIAGHSGCGKSTILQLLMGFIPIGSGEIRKGGKPVNIQELIQFRSKVGYVGQNGFLFNRSVRENLLYYVEDSEDNVRKAKRYLALFQLTAWIDSLPSGLEYVLTENAGTISGGEKQRLCIIRELMKDPEVLILDECTAHLDAATEYCVFQTLKKLMSDIIIIQVAHRSTSLSESDVVYVMEKGRIIASGSHQELEQGSAYYRELLKSLRPDLGSGETIGEI